MTIKLLVLGALCAFLGSDWFKVGTAQESVTRCEAGIHHCPGIVVGQVSADRMFGILAMR
jgi:hypothetical protein